MSLTESFTQFKDFLRDAFEAVPQAVMVVDEKRRILSVNSFLAQTIGLAPGEAVGKGSGEILGCVHARGEHAATEGSEPCKHCDLRSLITSALESNETLIRPVSMQFSVSGVVHELAFQVNARQLHWGGRRVAVIAMKGLAALASLRRPQTKNTQGLRRGYLQLIGIHPSMQQVYEFIEEVARTQLPVLIQGETGTGKELVALAIHQASSRAKGHFVPVNCAALPEGLLESELFGHVKGAFTGATEDRKGRFQLADGGSLMLDEIGELSPALQAKLLRVMQEQRFERLGCNQPLDVDCRVICSTNKELAAEVKSGRFRADLYYRLCVAVITLSSLRERRSDIPLLVDFFLGREAKKSERPKPVLGPEAMVILMEHDWPGNVRELKNVIQFAMMKCRNSMILPECFPSALVSEAARPYGKKCRKRKLEMEIVTDALHRTKGNRVKAAKLLNVSRSTLYRFMDQETDFPA